MLNYSTAEDQTHILNANALALKALIMVSKISSKIELNREWIVKIYAYIRPYLNEKEIPYAGEEDRDISANYLKADLYHTGFTLRGMLAIAHYLSLEEDVTFIEKRIAETLEEFLLNSDIVYVQAEDIIEIHSVAEYINLYVEIYNSLDDDLKEKYLNIIDKNVEKVSNSSGSYLYKIEKGKTIDIYFPRWSHSVMMNALSKLQNILNKNEIVV